MKKIAVFGGAFSPPHIGHASVIEAVSRLFPCDEVWLMPSADRHDKVISADANDRFRMLSIMVDELFGDSPVPISVSRFELDLPGHTLTYDTMKGLERRYPDHEFHFVVTSELLRDMKESWIKGKELFDEARFVVMERPGASMPDVTPPQATILDSSFAWIDVSSTFVRNLVSKGLSATPYLTPGVSKEIRKHKLYY